MADDLNLGRSIEMPERTVRSKVDRLEEERLRQVRLFAIGPEMASPLPELDEIRRREAGKAA